MKYKLVYDSKLGVPITIYDSENRRPVQYLFRNEEIDYVEIIKHKMFVIKDGVSHLTDEIPELFLHNGILERVEEPKEEEND